ncbi:MAG: methylmalonyl-CoA mutase family protein [Conexivisphaerales archaeon]
MNNIKKALDSWERKINSKSERFTRSGIPVKVLHTPLDVKGSYMESLGFPGKYPFTRGIHEEMYRKRLWTIREFSGYGDAVETNRRLKYLLQQGETGLSIAFDYPTLLGLDSDDELSRGEFGMAGVGISTLEDMELMFQDIPLGSVSTSMTINGPAAVIWAFYILAAEHQGVSPAELRGTIQNDILKEYMAQKSYIFPPEPSLKLVVDTIEYSSKALPQWNPISISGYHIREAGATAVQELAFTIANGLTYVEETVKRGLDIDDFAPRLSFFFDSSIYFFEEIAKFRAARRIWAREIRSRYKPKKERSMWMRFHTQTSGVSLTAQQPENNIVRTTIEAMAAVLGGTQSLHTNAMDEALGLPTELAATVALRTQQIIAEESGLSDTVDPAGGSYYLEWLTDEMEKETYAYLDRINSMGGVIKGIRNGFFQKEIAESSYRYQKEVEEKKRIIVGVNTYARSGVVKIPLLKVSERYERRQISRLREYRKDRDEQKVRQALNDIQKAAWERNLMPSIISATRARATLGEIVAAMKEVWGEFREQVIF